MKPRIRLRVLALAGAVSALASVAALPAPSLDLEGGLQEARELIRQRHFEAAEARIRLLLASSQRSFGDRSPRVAGALDLLAEVLWRSGRAAQPEALEAATRALEIRLDDLSSDAVAVVKSLITLAEVQRSLGRLERAEGLLEEARKTLRLQHRERPDLSANLEVLQAVLWTESADYEKAERALREAIAVLERTPEADPLDLGFAWTRLAILQRKLARDDVAEAAFGEAERVYRVIEERFGGPHPDSANVLVSRAILRDEQGRFEEAIADYERALATWLPFYGPEGLRVAIVDHNLGLLLRRLGEYKAATRSLGRARSTFVKLYGDRHPYTMSALQTEGELALLLGDLRTSADRFTRVLELREESLGPEAPEVGTAHLRLGELALVRRELDAAHAHFSSAHAAFHSSLGEDHPDLSEALLGLGRVALERGNGASALSAFQNASWLEERRGRERSSSHLAAVHGQARSELLSGRPEVARELIERVLSWRRESLATDHPLVVETLMDLAAIHHGLGSYDRSFRLAIEAENLARAHLARTITALGEKQLHDYASSRLTPLDLAYEMGTEGRLTPAQVAELFAAQVASRGVGHDEALRRSRAIRSVRDPEVQRLALRLAAAARRLSNLSLVSAAEVDPEPYERALREWEAAEAALGTALDPEQGRKLPREPSDLEQLLQTGHALISYVRFGSPPDSAASRYAAFVLRSGKPTPELIALGSAAEIDRAIGAWLGELQASAGHLEARRSEALGTAGTELRRLAWDPLEPTLAGVDTALIVPDGDLVQVNFAALPSGSSFLLEAGPLFHQLERERDLAGLGGVRAVSPSLLAVGGPAFDSSIARGWHPQGLAGDAVRSGAPSHLPQLPSSVDEARAAARIWESTGLGRAQVLVGEDATEAEFRRRAGASGALHLATHSVSSAMAEPSDLAVHFRFGLALAGFNHLADSGGLLDDGLLTAAEIATMDLSGVGLVFLNTCESGLGAYVRNEGVMGLRTGFRIAGVESMVVTLWPVDDRRAREWSEAFYGALGEVAFNVPEAVRRASSALLSRGRGAAAWAPFVSVGNLRFDVDVQPPPMGVARRRSE